MTWTWTIIENGDIEVSNDSGEVTESLPYGENGFEWSPPEPPKEVENAVAKHDFQAAWMGDIERRQDGNLPSSK